MWTNLDLTATNKIKSSEPQPIQQQQAEEKM